MKNTAFCCIIGSGDDLMKRLYMTQKAGNFIRDFKVTDIHDNIVYHIYPTANFRNRISVMNNDKKEIYSMRSKLFRLSPCYEIYRRDVHIATLKKANPFVGFKYHLDYKNWTIKRYVPMGDISIEDAFGNDIGFITNKSHRYQDIYDIKIDDEDNSDFVVMLTFIMDDIYHIGDLLRYL